MVNVANPMMTTILTTSIIVIVVFLTQLLFLNIAHAQNLANERLNPPSTSLMNLISPRDIAELTQVATSLAAQTFRSNGELMSKSGPEIKPVSLDARPSEIFGQTLTNMMSPVRRSLADTLKQPQNVPEADGSGTEKSSHDYAPSSNPGTSLIEQLAGKFLGSSDTGRSQFSLGSTGTRGNLMGMEGMLQKAMRVFSEGQIKGQTTNNDGIQSQQSSGANPFPTLNQLLPGAYKNNFGFRQGEGCVPFLGEFMKMAYGNCVKQADEKTWDTWGKELNNALMGGKIDILGASKETCKRGAEREHCGQLRKAISDCDIISSMTMATNLQRSVSRCDEITGLMDQNPSTVMNQMNGLINGEMAQGFLNNFLG